MYIYIYYKNETENTYHIYIYILYQIYIYILYTFIFRIYLCTLIFRIYVCDISYIIKYMCIYLLNKFPDSVWDAILLNTRNISQLS